MLEHRVDERQELVRLGYLVGQQLVPAELLQVDRVLLTGTELGGFGRKVHFRRSTGHGNWVRVTRRDGDVSSVVRVTGPLLQPRLEVLLVTPLGVWAISLTEQFDLETKR